MLAFAAPCGSTFDRTIATPHRRSRHPCSCRMRISAKNKPASLCVVPNPDGRFPCARHGEVGLEEAYTLAAGVREITRHDGEGKKQPIIAIVDLKSQAYGRREETAAIYLAAAAAADATAPPDSLVTP